MQDGFNKNNNNKDDQTRQDNWNIILTCFEKLLML